MSKGDAQYAVLFPNGTQARIVTASGRKNAIAKALNEQLNITCYNEGAIYSNCNFSGKCMVYELDDGVEFELKSSHNISAEPTEGPKI